VNFDHDFSRINYGGGFLQYNLTGRADVIEFTFRRGFIRELYSSYYIPYLSKKQKGGFFKVSPKQAAAQITESVIRDRETFSYCVEYLDKLHPNRKLIRDLEKEEKRKEKEAQDRENKRIKLEKELEETNKEISEEFTDETLDRYSY